MIETSALIKEFTQLVEKEGYTVFDVIISDWGITVKLCIEKDGEKSILPLREAFYDTNKEGKITKVHGVADIRKTPWYLSRRAG